MLQQSVHPDIPELHGAVRAARGNAVTAGMEIHVVHKPATAPNTSAAHQKCLFHKGSYIMTH